MPRALAMAPTPLNVTDRFINPETSKTYFADTVEDIFAPERAEMDAGVDLTGEVADMSGWEKTVNLQPTPDLGTRFTGRVPGRIEPGDAQIDFWADRGTLDIRDELNDGDQGYIFVLHGGDVAGTKMDVYKVDVAVVSKPINVGGDPARIMVRFAINAVADNVAVPAGS